MVKNLPTNAGDTGDVGSVPESGRSSISVWKIPQTEDAGGLQSMGSERVGHD